MSRRALLAAALLAVTACGIHRATPPPAGALHPEPDLAGVLHHVKRGETLYRIARAYGLPISELMEANGLTDPRRLEPGTELFVPGASRVLEVPPAPAGRAAVAEVEAEAEPEEAGGRVLRWPLRGLLYSRYGQRQGQRHDGIDIAAPEGTVIGAAAAGKVVFAGEQSGYGSIVILKHQGGLVTLYAHASALLVKEGQEVDGGAPIAKVGQSGRTTGPHLHFEVREGARPRNPLLYLP